MSSVNGYSKNDETVRQKREEYQKKESQLVKKHHKSLRQLSEQHQEEIHAIKESHSRQMRDLQNEMRNSIAKRDRNHKQQIDQLREMQRETLKRTAEDHQRKMEIARNAIKQEKLQNTEVVDERIEDLNRRHQEALRRDQVQHTMAIDELRDRMDKALKTRRDQQTESHGKELDAVREERRKTVGELRRNLDELRHNSAVRYREQQLLHFQDKQRMSGNFEDQVVRERKLNEAQKESLREGFAESLEDVKEKYYSKRQEDIDAIRGSREDFRQDVTSRYNRRISSLERAVADQKTTNIVERQKQKAQQQQQIDNIRDNWQKNLEVAQNERDMAVEQANKRNREDVLKVHEEATDLMQRSEKFHMEQRNMHDQINRRALKATKTTLQARNEQTERLADARVLKIQADAEDKIERLKRLFDDNLKSIRADYEQEKSALVQAVETDKFETVERMKDQVRKNEVNTADRLVRTVNEYEKQLNELKDRFVREKRFTDQANRRKIEQLQLDQERVIAEQKANYETKLEDMRMQHKSDIQSITKRHEQKMNEVISSVRKS